MRLLQQFLLLLCMVSSVSQAEEQPLVGHLPNGLQTIIWPGDDSEVKTAELRLLIRAGSLQEEDDQRGFAHFVEHLAFNNTRKFPKETLYRKLEELGTSVGVHSNAATGFDQTVYKLTLNDFTPEQLETAIDILAEWAQHVEFDQKVIDAEKPVIKEEWRTSEPLEKGWQARMIKVVYGNSRYGERLPIGKMEQVESAKVERLQAYYQRWYQPANAALIVTGAVRADTLQPLIDKYFAGWKGEDTFAPQPYNLAIDKIPARLVLEDDQVDGSMVLMDHYQALGRAVSIDEQFEQLTWQAGMDILEQRLDMRLQETGGSVSSFWVYFNQASPKVMDVSLAASLSGGDLQKATTLLGEERNRMLEQGVTAQELDTWRESYLRRQQLFQPKPAHLARMAEDYAMHGDALLTQAEWNQLFALRLPAMTPEAVNTATRRMLAVPPSVMLVHNPEIAVPDEKSLQTWLDTPPTAALKSSTLPPLAEWTINPDSKGAISATRTLPGGLQEWTLTNGIQVYYQYSKEQPNRVFYEMAGVGGLNRLDAGASVQARMAFATLEGSGLRGSGGPRLARWLQDASLHYSPSFGFWDRGASGNGPSADFALLMRLLHISLTEARVDDTAWKHNLESNRQQLEQFASSHTRPWREKVDEVLYGNDPALRQLKPDELEVPPARMEALYRDYFAGAQNYRLVIVGDISADDARKVVLESIATLPPSGQLKDVDQLRRFPAISKPVDVEIKGSGERYASVIYKRVLDKKSFPELDYDRLDYLSSWLRAVLMEELREKDGLVYSVSVDLEGSTLFQKDYSLSISLECDPDKVATLRERLRDVLQREAGKGPMPQRLLDWEKENRSGLKKSLEKPWTLASTLANAQLKGLSVSEAMDLDFRTRPPTVKQLQTALQKFMQEPALPVWMVWMP